MTSPSRARPSDRAIAQAFWALCGRDYSGDSSHVFANDVQVYATQLDRIPTSPEARVGDCDAVPQDVRYALDRMCTPLDSSRLGGATADADARCMKVIRDYIERLTTKATP